MPFENASVSDDLVDSALCEREGLLATVRICSSGASLDSIQTYISCADQVTQRRSSLAPTASAGATTKQPSPCPAQPAKSTTSCRQQ
jgi:hypothetical protein